MVNILTALGHDLILIVRRKTKLENLQKYNKVKKRDINIVINSG